MPIYEYKCRSCGQVSEHIHRISEKPALTCPHCKKDIIDKIISAPSRVNKTSNSAAEFEQHAIKEGSQFTNSVVRKPNQVKDADGHWVDADPEDS